MAAILQSACAEHRMARLVSTGQARLAAWKDQQSTWWQSQEGSTVSGAQDGKASKISRMVGLAEWSAGQLGQQRLQTARWTKGQRWQGEIGTYGVIEEKTPFILLSLELEGPKPEIAWTGMGPSLTTIGMGLMI